MIHPIIIKIPSSTFVDSPIFCSYLDTGSKKSRTVEGSNIAGRKCHKDQVEEHPSVHVTFCVHLDC
jgi:hypothetical protein